MILAELQIEHFKQYGERQTIEIPEQGVIAIVGVNGAGKTTLFEAIEWCLYGPRRLSRTEIWPRGGVNRPRVTLVLQARETGDRFRVERWLTAKGVEAAIYREDNDETPIVQGAREVTQYVERTLIGLSHGAFVSTFFTRQKELSFFGSDKPADRRREVARLLGHDTIKVAQDLVAADRKVAEAGATSLAQQYEGEIAGRDLAAELADASGQLIASERKLGETEMTVERARAVSARMGEELEFHRGKRHADDAFRHDLERVNGDTRTAAAQQDAALAAIANLDRVATQRATLGALADQLTERGTILDLMETALLRRQAAERFRERLIQAGRDEVRHQQRLMAILSDHPDDGLLRDWRWSPDGEEDASAAVARILKAIADFDSSPFEKIATGFKECVDRKRERDDAIEMERRYQLRRKEHETNRQRILELGDPAAELVAARAGNSAAGEAAANARARVSSELAAEKRVRGLIERLEDLQVEEPCPTCQRPFHGPDDISATVMALQSDAGRHASAAADAKRDQAEAVAALERSRRDESAANDRLAELVAAEKGIESSDPFLRDAREKCEATTWAFDEALRAAELVDAPDQRAIEQALRRAGIARDLVQARQPLHRLQTDMTELAQGAASAKRDLDALGPDDYDSAAHRAARLALEEAQAAVAKLNEIDRQLSDRPVHEQNLDRALAKLAAAKTDQTRIERQRTELGFDPAALEAARLAELNARAEERMASESLASARQDRSQAANDRNRLEREMARLEELQKRGIARRREADDLQRMQREFTEFDRYVADKVGPVLAERTSEFLTEMTDGRYTRAEFDHDYGLRVYDGEEAFPVSEFSGGERDVASLSARLALSTVIGGQAADPPRFIVLDEVFGSLDQERRSLVLEMLGKLAAESLPLNQLFIISHVEDVNASPVVDEVWQVRDAGGTSEVRRGGGPDGAQAL